MHIDGLPPYSSAPNPATPNLAVSVVADPATHDVLISIVPPKEPLSETAAPSARAPVDICCVIDVSGSMGTELKATLEEGKGAENTGLSALDVVKHAVKTIVATMQPDDRIAIVSFSTTAQIIAGLTHMNATGKAQVVVAVEKLQPINSTNLWDGLKTGMNVLNGLAAIPNSVVNPGPTPAARIRSLFLLTDGMPNINPPRGIVQALQSYIDSNPLHFSIHTYGFGYTLDTQLLLQIARLGSGAFGFIPDATSLGAVFIHAVANVYSTCADKVELSIEYPGDGVTGPAGELDISSCQGAIACSWGAKIDVGSVQYGQTRDFVVRIKNHPQLESVPSGGPVLSATVRYRPWTRGVGEDPASCTVSLTPDAVTNGTSEDDLVNLKYHVQRFAFLRIVDGLFKSSLASSAFELAASHPGPGSTLRFASATQSNPFTSSLRASATHRLQATVSALQSAPLASHAAASALADDLAGECLLALSSDGVYERWGQHYLPSLARLHLLQQCGGFREPGLQVYGAGSPLFTRARDALDAAFDALPPPQPSIRGVPRGRAAGGTWQPAHARPMSSTFARRSGPCFDGACEVTLAGGQKVPVKDLRRGVLLETPRGLRKVVAVLKTRTEDGTALLCQLRGGLKITPWHPIKDVSAGWVFPASHATATLQACDAVYSLLLEPDVDPGAHGVYVQDVLCVTLGHGITHLGSDHSKDDVRAHPFLGHYEGIVRSLATLSPAGVAGGVYRIAGTRRDINTGMICGFVPCNDMNNSTMFAGG